MFSLLTIFYCRRFVDSLISLGLKMSQISKYYYTIITNNNFLYSTLTYYSLDQIRITNKFKSKLLYEKTRSNIKKIELEISRRFNDLNVV